MENDKKGGRETGALRGRAPAEGGSGGRGCVANAAGAWGEASPFLCFWGEARYC
jgi:hypothetical protein